MAARAMPGMTPCCHSRSMAGIAAATANPLSYAVDLLRTAVYADGSGYFGLPLDVAVLAVLAAAAFLWGIGRRPAYQQ